MIGLGHIDAATARDAEALGMDVSGYDPGLSIENALKLPRSIALKDSVNSCVRDADYISLNIPYIKGEGGTHGIIGKDVIAGFKNGAVLLNFARGELVDSEALKALTWTTSPMISSGTTPTPFFYPILVLPPPKPKMEKFITKMI